MTDAFQSFCQRFGHFLFLRSKTENDLDQRVVRLTLPVGDSRADIGQNLGALARRYMNLRWQVALPRVEHNFAGGDTERRFRLWLDGWLEGDGYKTLTKFQRWARNPAMFWTKNWDVFRSLHVQYTIIEVLWGIFYALMVEMRMNDLSWNDSENDAVAEAVKLQMDAVRASLKLSKQTRVQELKLGALKVTMSAFSDWTQPVAAAGKVAKALVLGFAAFKNPQGKVQIDDHTVELLNTEWKQTMARKTRSTGGVAVTLRLVFDDLASLAAVIEQFQPVFPPRFLQDGGASRRRA
jgi:hypothetical protein